MTALDVPASQHMQALAQANRVRLARAELKRQIASGDTTVADVVLGCPWEVESMGIADLLMSQHRWGRSRCRRFLTSIPMTETKTIGSMTVRQRNELADGLRVIGALRGSAVVRANTRGTLHLVAAGCELTACHQLIVDGWTVRPAKAWTGDSVARCEPCLQRAIANGWEIVDA